jgi:hypothetical protein
MPYGLLHDGTYIVRFYNFTIMPPLTKGYEKISTVVIFIAVKILTSANLQFVHLLVDFFIHLPQPTSSPAA